MKVSLRELKTRTNQLVNILDQADKMIEKEHTVMMRKVKSATFDLFDMECDLANQSDINYQFKVYGRGIKFMRENDTNK